jgi:hypothetical protein
MDIAPKQVAILTLRSRQPWQQVASNASPFLAKKF